MRMQRQYGDYSDSRVATQSQSKVGAMKGHAEGAMRGWAEGAMKRCAEGAMKGRAEGRISAKKGRAEGALAGCTSIFLHTGLRIALTEITKAADRITIICGSGGSPHEKSRSIGLHWVASQQ
eukprot:1158223-Pelagomonas_calceolata.AAC.7